VVLVDFNPNTMRGRHPPDALVVTESTTVPWGHFFASDVESKLPYAQRTLIGNAGDFYPVVADDQIILLSDVRAQVS
jgi:hypothetical protein